MSKSTGSSKNKTGPKDESKRKSKNSSKSKVGGSKSVAKERNGTRKERKVDVRLVPISWWRERWSDRSIRRQFIENFIYVRDAFNGNRLVPMMLNDVQADLHERASGRDCILKSRRQGLSRYWLAAYLSNAVINSGRSVRLVPHDPDTEEEFRADLKMMFEQLPDHLRPETKHYSKDLIWIHDEEKGTVDSRLTTASVQPGHEGKGRGQTLTDLLLTEPPHWRGDPRKAATSLIEAAAGGQVAVESTAFGIEWFHSVYQNGKTGKGGWTSHFYEWWWKRDYQIPGFRIAYVQGSWLLVPPGASIAEIVRNGGRDGLATEAIDQLRFDSSRLTKRERRVARYIVRHLRKLNYVDERTKWHCDEAAAFIGWRRSKVDELPGGERQFLVEYPENDRDCFEQTGRPVVSAQYLKVTCLPAAPVDGSEYAIGCDTSLGLDSGDPSAIEIIEVQGGRQVHDETLKQQPDLLAYRLAELSDLYNNALIVVERNNSGIATIRKLLELGYEWRVYRHLDARLRRAVEDGRMSMEEACMQAQFGFPTTQESKPVAAISLEEGLRRGWLGLSSQAFCDEAKTVVWSDNGSFGALPGYHDDRFMALAIVWFVTRIAKSTNSGFVGAVPETG
jgi:hypothetical protein